MTRGAADAPGDHIEDYLDRLLVSLSGSPRQVRHTLAEVEAHLRDAVAEGIAAGLPEETAQAQALERIGPVHAVTGRPALLTRPSGALLRRLTLTAALVGGAGFVAIGGAGLVGRLLQALKGNLFLTTPFPPGTYTRTDCARWLAGDPGTRSCVTAMLADHAFDYLLQAAACGLLGLAGLAAYLVLRQRWNDRATTTALPAGTAEALGLILAAIAAVFCLGQAADLATVQRGVGVGEPLSLGIAATVTAAAFALALWRCLRAARLRAAQPLPAPTALKRRTAFRAGPEARHKALRIRLAMLVDDRQNGRRRMRRRHFPMTPLVWASLALAALCFGAWYGIPMWMTFKRPERHPDFSEARAYLRAKAALAKGESVITVPAGLTTARRHMTATRAIVPGRQHAGAGLAPARSHPAQAPGHTHAPA